MDQHGTKYQRGPQPWYQLFCLHQGKDCCKACIFTWGITASHRVFEITCFFLVGKLLARCFDNGKEHSWVHWSYLVWLLIRGSGCPKGVQVTCLIHRLFQSGKKTRPSAGILMATLSLQIISLLQGRFQDAMGIFHGAVVFQQVFNMFWLFRSCKFGIFFT